MGITQATEKGDMQREKKKTGLRYGGNPGGTSVDSMV